MDEHSQLLDIANRIFNAAQKFEADTRRAAEFMELGHDVKFPAAYPVITPLIEELVKYCDEQMEETKQECHRIAMKYVYETDAPENEKLVARIIAEAIQFKSVRPSSPFRSVEIQDGTARVVE